MAMSASWIFLLLAFNGGGNATDLVSLIPSDDYFKSHQVEVTPAKMVELAAKEPKEAKDQIAQLLAIRWLADHPDDVKKEKIARETLEGIAKGKIAPDPQGFAKDYAERTLAVLDGKPLPSRTVPENSVRTEALSWFPANVSFFGAFDTRGTTGFKPLVVKPMHEVMDKMIPAREREEMYKFVDEVGNLRIDRMSFALSPDPNQRSNGRIFMRFTGKGDSKRFLEFVKQHIPGAVVKEEKGPKGETIRLLGAENQPPAFGVIGDTELIMAGYEGNQGKHMDLVQEALEVRAGKKDSIIKGPASGQLKTIPADASALVMGVMSDDIRREFGFGGQLPVMPRHIILDLTRGKEISLNFRGTMDSADDAKKFKDSIDQLKQQAAEGLKALPGLIKIKDESVKALGKTLDGIKMEAKDDSVSGGVKISGDALKALGEVVEGLLQLGGVAGKT